MSEFRLGVDVGGTHTDAVLVDPAGVLHAKAKVATTPDVTAGIDAAIAAVLATSWEARGSITHVMVGTTHATNAILECRGLRRVALIRIGSPAARALPPLATWSPHLRDTVSAGTTIVGGGFEFDGRELAPLDEDAVAAFLDDVHDAADAVAVAGVFAPISPDHELRVGKLVLDRLGDVPVSLSHELGTLGLIERENATVLNAALHEVVERVANGLVVALAGHAIAAQIYFAQNDGTLMSLAYALDHPVLTIGSGPANSISGAARLTGVTDALVVDVGGTSSDVGALVNGYPRESMMPTEVGGVANNFRMPDLISLRLGGGTLVRLSNGGPRAILAEGLGMDLSARALVFGGDTATLTDAAVAAGCVELGDPSIVARHHRELGLLLADAQQRLSDAVGCARTGRADVDLVAVGGAAFLVPDAMPGIRRVIRPEHAEVANAIGAATASVGGRVDRVVSLRDGDREQALGEACAAARLEAIRAGADPESTEIVETEVTPLTHVAHPAVRLRVRAAGPLGRARS